MQQNRYPLIPTATCTTTRPNFSPRTNTITHPLLSNHIQQQIHNFIQPIHNPGLSSGQTKDQQQQKITITKPKLIAHLQNKRNQNGNRHKTKKQLLNKIQKQKAGDNICIYYWLHNWCIYAYD
jgi:hypothetical protein